MTSPKSTQKKCPISICLSLVCFGAKHRVSPLGKLRKHRVCGGFPCQPFSVAGKRRGFEDTRGTLFYHIARVIKHKRPAAFLLENVPGLLSHGEGQTYLTILRTLSELGYCIEWFVHNSAGFGVPQSRKRVYIVGYLRADMCWRYCISLKNISCRMPRS